MEEGKAVMIYILPHIAPTGRRALSARRVGACRGAACYALRRKAHNESMRKTVSQRHLPLNVTGSRAINPAL